MRLVWILLIASLTGCADSYLHRERGDTKDGYTSYKTTLHLEFTDEPVCHGSCQK